MPVAIKLPMMLLARIWGGFVLKLPLLWLDRFDKEPLDTMGWNLICRKPVMMT